MMNYKGFNYEYDEMFGWTLYDEDFIPVSGRFESKDDVIVTIDKWVA